MASPEAVIHTFCPFGEAAKPPILTQGGELGQPAGKEFMDIGLMPHIPDDFIPGHGKHFVKSHGEFHHPQIRGQMPAILTGHLQDFLPDFLAEFRQLFIGDFLQV